MTRGVGRRILGTECAHGHWAGSSCRWLMRDGGPRAPRPARLDKQWRARGATRRDPRRRSAIGCRHARAANGGVSWRSRRDARRTTSGQPHHRQAPPPRRWPLVRADTDEAKEPCRLSRTADGLGQADSADLCFVPATHDVAGRLPAVRGLPGRLVLCGRRPRTGRADLARTRLRGLRARLRDGDMRLRGGLGPTYAAAQHRRGAPATAGGLTSVGRAAGPAPRGAYPWYKPTSARTRAACARDADRRGAVGGAPRRSASLAASLLREALRGA